VSLRTEVVAAVAGQKLDEKMHTKASMPLRTIRKGKPARSFSSRYLTDVQEVYRKSHEKQERIWNPFPKRG
jgi:hypothetical protein